MRKERAYVQPSCVLQVWWEGDRRTLNQLGFVLRFNDDQSVQGDLGKLWTLVHTIDDYIHQFLGQDFLPAREHSIMGLHLTSSQLVDACNAIEELRGEVILLPVESSSPRSWVGALVVGVTALALGTTIGVWLASRPSRLEPAVVLAPQEVVKEPPPAGELPQPSPPQPLQRSAHPQQPSKPNLPPIRVYPPPPVPPPLEKTPPELPPEPTDTPPEDRELPVGQIAPLPADKSEGITIEGVEISTSEALTQDLITYLRSVPLPPGTVTIDVAVTAGKVEIPTIENNDPALVANWTNLLSNWQPIEPAGRVRLQVTVP